MAREPAKLRKPIRFIVTDGDDIILKRGVPGHEIEKYAENCSRVIVYREEYHECPRCVNQRRAFTCEAALRMAERGGTYFCSSCNSSGWVIEDIRSLKMRLGVRVK